MSYETSNGKRFNEYLELSEVKNSKDILLVRSADGTGVKAIPLGVIKAYIEGDLKTLNTKDKTSLIAAINELSATLGVHTKNITNLTNLTKLLATDGASLANSLVVEQDLGTTFTAEQSQDIRSGKFEKVRTGGYWTIHGRKYWAAHADYRLHCGQKEVTQHHMLVIPDVPLCSGKMNDTDTTNGGYHGSKMKTSGLAEALRIIEADFGAEHILPYSAILSNAVSGGMISGWAWYDDQKIDLMSEHMVCGSYAWGGGSQNGYDIGADKSQLALFQARHDLINCRSGWYWLRDIGGSNYFCTVNEGGNANTNYASHSGGVRPAFLLY